MTDQFIESRKALVHSAADEVARQHFKPEDILILPSEPAPSAPGFPLSLARSMAKKIADEVSRAPHRQYAMVVGVGDCHRGYGSGGDGYAVIVEHRRG